MDDWQLLSEYVQKGSQSVFREVVNRHVDLVYATCRRVVRDAHLAEDATQAVFVILAKKARTIRRNMSLVGWLHNTARYVSCNALRVAANRRRHEMEAAQMPGYKRSAEQKSNHAAEDVVDRALNRLEAQERDAILLRFFEGRSFREVGAALSISEEAAKKRVWRGIEKLRQILTPSGGAAPAAATIAGILAASHPAPATLASVAAATALTGTGAAFSLAKGAVIAMAISKTKATTLAVILTILLMGGAAVVVKDLTNHPKAVSYSIPASKPATQPVADESRQLLAEWVLDTVPVLDKKVVGEPLVVVAPICSHLETNPKAAATNCVACHTAPHDPVKVNLNTGKINWAGDLGAIYLGRNVRGMLVLDNGNLLAGNVLIPVLDNNGLAAGTDAPAIDVKQADGRNRPSKWRTCAPRSATGPMSRSW
jgi:RNA polymerase sigma factor (sigma-70 family)